VKLLHESLGHIITVELKTGQLYRGKLAEGKPSLLSDFARIDCSLAAEDNLNISLKDITVTGRDGRVSQLDQVYIRGSMVRFFIVPDMLQNAPMYVVQSLLFIMVSSLGKYRRFKRVGPNAMRGRGIGTARGRATIMRGLFHLFIQIWSSNKVSVFPANGRLFPSIRFRYLFTNCLSHSSSRSRCPAGKRYSAVTRTPSFVAFTNICYFFVCITSLATQKKLHFSNAPNCTAPMYSRGG
jgi:small nuclear ribonucleoprotein D3